SSVPPRATLCPYTTLFRSQRLLEEDRMEELEVFRREAAAVVHLDRHLARGIELPAEVDGGRGAAPQDAHDLVGADPVRHRAVLPDRKSTRLNSSHVKISYA